MAVNNLRNAFSALKTNRLTRNFGGAAGVAEPYTSGTHFIHFGKLPVTLPFYTMMQPQDIQSILSAACLSVTPPGGTLNRNEFPGLGGLKYGTPGTIDYGTTVSIKFLEFHGTPIFKIIHGWIKLMKDNITGLANYVGEPPYKKLYAGILYYWTTPPNAKEVDYYACYDGVWPMKDPHDLFTSDIESQNRLDIDIDFSIDRIWHEDWVFAKCTEYLQLYAADRLNVMTYGIQTAAQS